MIFFSVLPILNHGSCFMQGHNQTMVCIKVSLNSVLYTSVWVYPIGNNVSPDMLFHRLFIASSPKLYFSETLTCIQHGYWLGAVDHPAYVLDLRTPPPPFVGTPPPLLRYGMVIRQSDRINCLPGHVGRGWYLQQFDLWILL